MPPTIAIIGAGPSGSSAAFHLARAGFDVTLLEARPFPRVKVCGEFISPAATHLLEAILPPRLLLDAGARRVDRFVLQLADRSRVLPMPSPAWALSRRTLDDLLLQSARDAGATVLQPAPVVEVRHDGSPVGTSGDTDPRPQLRLADASTLRADLVLHADGHGRFCPSPPTPAVRGLLGFKCHFIPGRPIAGVTIRSAPGAYVGTIQVEAHERDQPSHATIALVARRELLAAHRGDIDAMVAALWPAWEAARRTTDWLSCGVVRAPMQPSGHLRAFRLGNAAAAVDPVGGEGIGLALWSGATLAELLAGALARSRGRAGDPVDDRSFRDVHRRYALAYRRRLLLRRPACLLAGECLMRPGWLRMAWPLLGVPALTLVPWYAATGKPVLRRAAPAPGVAP